MILVVWSTKILPPTDPPRSRHQDHTTKITHQDHSTPTKTTDPPRSDRPESEWAWSDSMFGGARIPAWARVLMVDSRSVRFHVFCLHIDMVFIDIGRWCVFIALNPKPQTLPLEPPANVNPIPSTCADSQPETSDLKNYVFMDSKCLYNI